MARKINVHCPECGEDIEFEAFFAVGETIYCDSCDAELKIASLDPPRLKVLKGSDDDQDDYYTSDDDEEDSNY
ncbi:MAG: hypothetical protein HQL30_07045 [Candidatus Omnitrophica bacterium]|nr:hypothetical protein [Candidatus Omnitrophota bacterium]